MRTILWARLIGSRFKPMYQARTLSSNMSLLRLSSYLASMRLAYASYLPYMYDRTVSTVYRTHFGLCRYLDT
jgi:hypothetical protein